jgi:hypothetical protein
MPRSRGSRWRRALAVVCLLTVSGCGVGPWSAPKEPPAPLPPDQLVLSVQGWGGLVPPLVVALTTPGVALYGDGRLVTLDRSSTAAAVPFGYQVSTVGAAEVAALVADAEAADLVNDRTDFGTPSITDMPVTTVRLHGRTGPHQASVYALSDAVEDDLGWRQRRARAELRAIIDRALALPGDTPPVPYRPEQVRVIELRPDEDDPAGADWPGPDPDTFLRADSPGVGLACGTLSGTAAERAYTAARVNPGGIWSVDGRPRVFAVAALLPGAEGCRS